jgi:hypothetical protein
MTADVIELAARRPAPRPDNEPTCGCPAHILGALEERLQDYLRTADTESLLIDGPAALSVLADALDATAYALDRSHDGRPHLETR